MKKQYLITLCTVFATCLPHLSLLGVFDRGSIVPKPLVNENSYYGPGQTPQQGIDDNIKNPYNNPDLKEEKEQYNGQMRYAPHSIEILRPSLQ